MLITQAISFIKENLPPDSRMLVPKRYIKAIKPPASPKKVEKIEPAPFFQPIIERKTKEKPVLLQEALIEKAPEKATKERPLLSFADFNKILQRFFPYFILKESPPDDRTALAMSNPSYIQALEADVVIFSFQESQESDLFLQNISQAITRYHTPASIFFVASCKTEDELSLFLEQMQAKVVLTTSAVLQKKLFLPFIKELPVSSEHYLHKSRMILLEPFTHYFTHPQKKKALWQTLCTLLKNPNMPASS
ncbi:MAG: hypothetical protein V4489_05970 [Chlamydiota bacterium]